MFFKRKAKKALYNPDAVPAHVGIIMDGNGRWARRRGLPRSAGHRAGSNALRDITKACGKMGMTALTVYAFSTENWKRPKEEVDNIMSLLLEFLRNAEREIDGQNVQIRVIGDVSAFSEELQSEIKRVEGITSVNDGLVLNIALNYGGRSEIARAVRTLAEKAVRGEISPDEITEEEISQCMYTASLPDPDLIIRPSGEYRLSNFMIWQSAYSEFWFSDILWPDFTVKDLQKAIGDFQKRNRRFGGLGES